MKEQLYFSLYACSREIVRRYRPLLEQLGLTYTQYIAMMVLWEERSASVKALGDRLLLDSGTLTPLLRKLEKRGLVSRRRSAADERSVIVTATEQGMQLRRQAAAVPEAMASCLALSAEEALEMYRLLYKLLGRAPGQADAT